MSAGKKNRGNRSFDADGKLHGISEIAGTYSADTGLVYWDLVQGATVSIRIVELGVASKITVPAEESARLADLL